MYTQISTLLKKAAIGGLITGTVFLLISPLGLAIGFVEELRPVLAPGLSVIRALDLNSHEALLFLGALVFNVVIYFLLIFLILLGIKVRHKDSKPFS